MRATMILLLLLTVACAGEPGETTPAAPAAEAASAPAGLSVTGARAAMMPGGMGAVYLRIENPGPEADRLVKVETLAAAVAEIHESLEEDGVMRMVAHPDGFEIPAGESVELAPGGKHVMLMQATAPAEGPLTLNLHFERAGTVVVKARVEDVTTMSGEGG